MNSEVNLAKPESICPEPFPSSGWGINSESVKTATPALTLDSNKSFTYKLIYEIEHKCSLPSLWSSKDSLMSSSVATTLNSSLFLSVMTLYTSRMK